MDSRNGLGLGYFHALMCFIPMTSSWDSGNENEEKTDLGFAGFTGRVFMGIKYILTAQGVAG